LFNAAVQIFSEGIQIRNEQILEKLLQLVKLCKSHRVPYSEIKIEVYEDFKNELIKMREFQQLEDEGSHDGFPLNMETPNIRQIRVKNEDNPEIPDHCSEAKAPVT
jgi:hypothetical protein